MRVVVAIVALSVLALMVLPTVRAQSAPTVTIRDFEFGPGTLRVTLQSGTQQIRWLNSGPATHTVVADQGAFNSGRLAPGGSFTFSFSTTGTYAYHCEIHPAMKGQIVVEAAKQPGDGGY